MPDHRQADEHARAMAAQAFRDRLRRKPSVILIQEHRDKVRIEAAVEAALAHPSRF